MPTYRVADHFLVAILLELINYLSVSHNNRLLTGRYGDHLSSLSNSRRYPIGRWLKAGANKKAAQS
jgi:hypothetical protein